MLFVRRILTFIILLLGLLFAKGQTPTAEELVGIHRLTATEINAIASPIIGTLVYNTTTNSLQTYTGSVWEVSETLSTLVDNGNGTFTYTDEDGGTITFGTIWPQGPVGPQGQPGQAGQQGPQGQPGQNGQQGPQGQKGDTGDTGPQGQQEPQGQAGQNGQQGPQGQKGDTGDTGPQGPPGNIVTKIIDVYDSNSSYTIPNNSFIQVQLNNTRINIGGVFSINNNQVTISETGTYEIEYGLAARTDVWSSIEAKLRLNGSDIAATSTYNGGWYKPVTASRKIYLAINANDIISIWAQRTDFTNNNANAINTIQNGSFLLIRRLD